MVCRHSSSLFSVLTSSEPTTSTSTLCFLRRPPTPLVSVFTTLSRCLPAAAMSNETVVTAAQTSAVPSGNRASMSARKFTRPRFGMTTPFGRPVEPEV